MSAIEPQYSRRLVLRCDTDEVVLLLSSQLSPEHFFQISISKRGKLIVEKQCPEATHGILGCQFVALKHAHAYHVRAQSFSSTVT